MSVLHVFNPDHDEALAAGSPYYTPTRAARVLAESLAALPAWWGAEGDAVLVAKGQSLPPVLNGCSLTAAPCWDTIDRIAPWGWDAALVHRLRRLGAPERLLPSADELDEIRRLSSRHTAVGLLQAVRQDVPAFTVGESLWCTSDAEVRAAVDRYGSAFVKAPWSCSGRGVFPLSPQSPEAQFRRAVRILERQGALEVEPFYQRQQDFAIEFSVTPEAVRYEGLSLFRTSDVGAYVGNIVAPDAQLCASFDQPLRAVLDNVRQSLERHLAKLLVGRYVGPLGVDLMLVTDAEGRLCLHPCIEVNLRRTMGFVAIALRRFLTPTMPRALYALRPVAPLAEGEILLTPGDGEIMAVLAPEVSHPDGEDSRLDDQ